MTSCVQWDEMNPLFAAPDFFRFTCPICGLEYAYIRDDEIHCECGCSFLVEFDGRSTVEILDVMFEIEVSL